MSDQQRLRAFRAHPVACVAAICLSLFSLASIPFLHRTFVESFASQLSQLKVTADAPGARTVRVYWDDPSRFPTSYTTFPVADTDFRQTWHIHIEALPDHNPAARHNQLWLFSIRTPEQPATWSDIALTGWTLLEDKSIRGMNRQVGRAIGSIPNSLSLTLTGSRLNVVVGRSEFSGKVRVTINGVSEIIDLYSRHWNIAELTFFATAPSDYGARTHDVLIKRGQGYWNKLRFVPDNDGRFEILHVSVDGSEPSTVDLGTFTLRTVRWPAYRQAAVVTAIVCLLLVSTVLLGSVLAATGDQSPAPSRHYDYLAAASFAGLLATVLTTIFYPGVFDPDTIARWQRAWWILNDGAPLSIIGTWAPPLMTLLMLGTYGISGVVGLATFLQVFFFYYCLGLLSIDLFGRRMAIVFGPLVGLVPVVCIHSAALSLDTGTAIALMSCAILIDRRRERRSPQIRIGPLLLFLLSCFLLLGLRHNSVALIPPLLLLIWLLLPLRRVRIAYTAVVLVAATITYAVPGIIGAKVLPMSSVLLLWEHVGTLKQLNIENIPDEYRLEGVGDIARAIHLHQYMGPDNLIFGENAPFPAQAILERSTRVEASFRRLVREHPLAFLANRVGIYASLLGITAPLYNLYWFDSTTVDPQVSKSGFRPFYYNRDEASLAMKVEAWNASIVTLPGLRLLFRPWFLIATLVVTVCLCLCLRLPLASITLVGGLALAYFGSFFILGAGAAFRYYFPAYVLLQLAILACVVQLGQRALGIPLSKRHSVPSD